MKAVNNM